MIALEFNRRVLYQWDKCQRVVLDGYDAGTDVHFSMHGCHDNKAPCVKAYEHKGAVYADIPNMFLCQAGKFYVYVYLCGGGDEAHTCEVCEVTVVARPKPDDYIYEETEIYTVDKAVNDAVQEAADGILKAAEAIAEDTANAALDGVAKDANAAKDAAEKASDDLAKSNEAVAKRFSYTAEGYSSDYAIHSPGWKRVAVLIRANSGMVNIALSNATGKTGRTMQNICIGYSGYADYPSRKNSSYHPRDPLGKPQLFQVFNHSFGEDPAVTDPARIFRIDKVRISYPKNYEQINDDGNDERYYNPVNVYLDVHIAADPSVDWSAVGDGLQFMANVVGKSLNHDNYAITEETNCTDPVTGLYGVLCDTHELTLAPNSGLYVPQVSAFNDLVVDTVYTRSESAYVLNSGDVISGRDGSKHIKTLKVPGSCIDGVYLQPICANMLVEACPKGKTLYQGVTFRRNSDGSYSASGVCTAAGVFRLMDATKPKDNEYYNPPIILKAGEEYYVRDCQVQVSKLADYIEAEKAGNFSDMPVRSYNATTSGTYSIPADTVDRVVWRAAIFVSKGKEYDNNTFYPQLCRVSIAPLKADDERFIPHYSPKATYFAMPYDMYNALDCSIYGLTFDFASKSVVADCENDSARFYTHCECDALARVFNADISYANELQIYRSGTLTTTSEATLGIAVDTVGDISAALDGIIMLQRSLIGGGDV